MSELDLLLAGILVAIGLGSALFGFAVAFVFGYSRTVRPSPSTGQVWDDSPHSHRFDTMLADGAGWRCGICGRPKRKGT